MDESGGVALKEEKKEKLQVRVLGIVQGVGFRPFVYRLAKELRLNGWVRNDGNGVTVEVEGNNPQLLEFLRRLQEEKPAPAFLYAIDHRFSMPSGYQDFEIRKSESLGPASVWILPDLATCLDCRQEILSPENRRFRYPFTNCTHCGPRFTIIEDLPYDRPRTVMKMFQMCDPCEQEYRDPVDRRFHAQPNACPKCGPELDWQTDGAQKSGVAALCATAQAVREGKIVALKGLGGFHLIVDARNEVAVAELRKRKKRQNKPFAVMYPDLDYLQRHVEVPEFAEPFLTSTQAPILLLCRTADGWKEIASSVAPFSPYLGVFLPYTPLHILLLNELGFPVVATSGNLTDEPIQFQAKEAFEKLGPICDAFLTHDRPIVRQADDSVIQIITRPDLKPQMLRRARGYTPLPVLASRSLPPLLALGGHMNVTLAVSRDREVILSQHLGDMDSFESRQLYQQTLNDFQRLYNVNPVAVVHDLHPDYFTTQLAQEMEIPHIAVQHHHAHLAACMLENQIEETVLGCIWDGTGYGSDQTIWGGEFLMGTPQDFERVASLHPFRLPAGEKAIKETWRTALALLKGAFGKEIPRDLPLFHTIQEKPIELTLQILEKDILSPLTTSMGRLFDGVSAMLGISYFNTHQAESAQLLEYAAWRSRSDATAYSLPVSEQEILRLDWRPLVRELVEDYRKGVPLEILAARFHLSLVDAVVNVARLTGMSNLVLAGGVFCNRFLTEAMLTRLEEERMNGYIHSQLPPTDGSLAAGQIWVAARQQ